MRYSLILIVLCLFLTACQRSSSNTANNSEAKRYPLKGKVVSVDKDAKTATIAHEEVPGVMTAMTMPFPIHETWIWDDLTPGSEIHAELVVDNKAKDPYWLEKVAIVAVPNPDQSPLPVDDRFAQIGKPVPDFTLTNQDGKKISIKDFRGKALAITFIYARCPLPDACIRMSTNFSDLANRLQNDPPEVKDRYRLLSISFDPENDTPAKLRQYGIGYLGNPKEPDFTNWQLAVGNDAEVRKIATFFGLDYKTDENDKAQINHNLRTAVISPEGIVTKIYSGNTWTTDELFNEMRSTLNRSS